MPRLVNFVKSEPFKPVALAHQRFGFNEIELWQRRFEEDKYLQWRHHQFETIAVPGVPPQIFQQAMNQAFKWLSDHTTGPWHWMEAETDKGGFAVKVHIERISDQRAFQDKHKPLFTYKKDTKEQLAHLAVINNVLPQRISVNQWCREHDLKVTFGTKAGCVEVEADTQEKAEAFMAAWGDQFKSILTDDNPAKFKRACFAAGILRAKPVVIPADFMAYLRGECDFSAVRTLPKPNGVLPQLEMACK